MKRIPNRTLLLMILALAAFVRLYCATHSANQAERQERSSPTSAPGSSVEIVPLDQQRDH